MSDIEEDILMSYFPSFLDRKMLKFVELKFKLEDKLRQITKWKTGKRKRRIKRHTHRHVEGKFKSIEKEDISDLFWISNRHTHRVMAKEIRQKVTNLAKFS